MDARARRGLSPPRSADLWPPTGAHPPAAEGPGRPGDAWAEAPAGPGDDVRCLDDGLLAARAGEGDDDAFAVLVQRHSGPLLALACHMLVDLSDAEEAVQEALVSAWRRLPEFRGDAAFHTWMHRIVTNRCLNVLRARTPAVSLDAVPEPAAQDGWGEPARAAESAAATKALGRALRDLRPEQRACWVLREFDGLSYEEIAQVVGESAQTVRGRLFRARRTLTREMAAWR